MIRGAVVLLLVYLALIAQDFLPPMGWFEGAPAVLVPLLFSFGALVLPFPGMLVLALATGLLSDLAQMHLDGERVEISLGWSMVFYVFYGTVLHLLLPLAGRARWELHALAAGAGTALLLLAQYLMVCLRRGSFLFDQTVWWHIAGPAVVALFAAPAVFFLLSLLPAGHTASGGALRRSRP